MLAQSKAVYPVRRRTASYAGTTVAVPIGLTPRDRNGTLSLVFALCVPLAPLCAPLAIFFAIRSRRQLGYRSIKAWVGLIIGSFVLALFILWVVLIVMLAHSRLTF